MKQLECKNLSIGYDGNSVINNINFEVNKGDYLCIIGENGAGKSTLMKTLLGLKEKISGDIVFTDDLKQTHRGYLSQQTITQKEFPASVKEVVLSGFQSKHKFSTFYTKQEKTEALENMKLMGVENLSKSCYRELSGGQQQRVLIARALCATDNMLFLDEPVSSLDPNSVTEMYSLIEKLNKEKQISIVMITHDITGALECATHILHLGNTVFFGTKDEYLESLKQ